MKEAFSILNRNGEVCEDAETEAFHQDLNLLQIIDKMTQKWGRDIRKYFVYLPKSPEEEAYRRAVYGDVKNEAVYDALVAYTKKLSAWLATGNTDRASRCSMRLFHTATAPN